MVGRSLEDIRTDGELDDTIRNLVDALHAKLHSASRYGMYEYQAAQAGREECAEVFRRVHRQDRAQIRELLVALAACVFDDGAKRVAGDDPPLVTQP